MSPQELLTTIRALPLAEQCELLAALAQGIKQRAESEMRRVPVPSGALRGLAKTDAAPPTDAEIKEDYATYLAEKYS